jgi:hypothetical protein
VRCPLPHPSEERVALGWLAAEAGEAVDRDLGDRCEDQVALLAGSFMHDRIVGTGCDDVAAGSGRAESKCVGEKLGAVARTTVTAGACLSAHDSPSTSRERGAYQPTVEIPASHPGWPAWPEDTRPLLVSAFEARAASEAR